MLAMTKAWAALIFLGFNLTLSASAFAGGNPGETEALRQNIKIETAHQCLLGNFDFRAKLLRQQLEFILTGRHVDMLSIKNCQTLGDEIAKSLTESELQALLSEQGKTEALQERDQLLNDLTQKPEVFKQKGKIAKVLANGVYYGLIEFSSHQQ